MATFEQKLSISAGSAVLFALVNLPQVYQVTNNLLPLDLYANGCPTNLGLVVHAIVFFVISYLTMGNSNIDNMIKIKHSLYGTLIFYLLSSPAVFALVGSVIPGVANAQGCPTLQGVLVHAVVYCMALVAVMYLPEGNK